MAIIEAPRSDIVPNTDDAMRLETDMALGQVNQFFSNPKQPEIQVINAKGYDGKWKGVFQAIYDELGVRPPDPETRSWSPIGEDGEHGEFSLESFSDKVRQNPDGTITGYRIADNIVRKPSGQEERYLRLDRAPYPHARINGISGDQVDLARTALSVLYR